MDLKHIALSQLSVSAANMRARGKTPDIANILPSVRSRGVLVPLIVRQNGTPETFEIVAGKRRFHAAQAVAAETGEAEPLPCAVMAAGDDAAALEASLIENVARLDPDEVTRWESFTRLVREGRSVDAIAATFGLTELQVRRTLALGNLLPRVRTLYRRGEIDVATVRHLTLATRQQQRDWLALGDDPASYCPTGAHLKSWLFGGAAIPVKAALFDMATYTGETVSDLFGEDAVFASTTDFWTAQMQAVEERAAAYREAGWSEVVVLPTGSAFHTWEHERTPKRKGGKVIVAVGSRGEVTFHEGYLTLKEVRRAATQTSEADKPVRPEVSAPLQVYIDLHRHAAVRAEVAEQPGVALRLMVAHAIAGSALWRVQVEPQRAGSDAVAESVELCPSEGRFDQRRRTILATLGFDPDTPTVTGGYDGPCGAAGLFLRLAKLRETTIAHTLSAPVSFIVHSLSDVNAQLERGRPFFIDIVRQGIALYEAEGFCFTSPRDLPPDEALIEARGYFEHWCRSAGEFAGTAEYARSMGWNNKAAFDFHQAVERLYHCTLLTLTLYSPKSHRLNFLRSQAEQLVPELATIWPRKHRFPRRCFELLRQAYVNARYSPHYEITAEELAWISERVAMLQDMVRTACEARLAPGN